MVWAHHENSFLLAISMLIGNVLKQKWLMINCKHSIKYRVWLFCNGKSLKTDENPQEIQSITNSNFFAFYHHTKSQWVLIFTGLTQNDK